MFFRVEIDCHSRVYTRSDRFNTDLQHCNLRKHANHAQPNRVTFIKKVVSHIFFCHLPAFRGVRRARDRFFFFSRNTRSDGHGEDRKLRRAMFASGFRKRARLYQFSHAHAHFYSYSLFATAPACLFSDAV